MLSKNYSIEFSCNAGGILKRTVQFGEIDEDDDVPPPSTTPGSLLTPAVSSEYEQEFVTDQLCRITKLSGLSTNMQIFPGKPLLFSSAVGSLGKICIYIKSKEQIDSENYTVDSDCESD